MSVIQFSIPTAAAQLVWVDTIRARATDAGLADTRYTYTLVGPRCRVTCSLDLAEFLVKELRAAKAVATDPELVAACDTAIAATLNEIEIGPHDRPRAAARPERRGFHQG